MENFYIEGLQFVEFIKRLSESCDVFSPVESGRGYSYKKCGQASELNGIIFNEYRPEEPIKSFFTHAVENVADLRDGEKKKKTVIWGVKACDLHSLKVQDYVFNDESLKDPFYSQKRKDTVILSSDCTSYKECCFCLAVGVEPYPEEGFDINFTPVSKGYIATVGSEKGRMIIAEGKNIFREVGPDLIEQKFKVRDEMSSKLKQHLVDTFKIDKSHYPVINLNMDKHDWDNEVAKCVECGACNLVCPTCHCFLLADQINAPGKRFKKWDACLYSSFAKVAGGANPRKQRAERLKNRFEKKFVFFPDVLKEYACTGCGRCVSGCPAKIDIRNVMKSVSGQNG